MFLNAAGKLRQNLDRYMRLYSQVGGPMVCESTLMRLHVTMLLVPGKHSTDDPKHHGCCRSLQALPVFGSYPFVFLCNTLSANEVLIL